MEKPSAAATKDFTVEIPTEFIKEFRANPRIIIRPGPFPGLLIIDDLVIQKLVRNPEALKNLEKDYILVAMPK